MSHAVPAGSQQVTSTLEFKKTNCKKPCFIDILFLTADLVKLKAKHSENETDVGITCDCKESDQFVLHDE
jgi:hypothetical protein